MKLRITDEQLKELSYLGKGNLRRWLMDNNEIIISSNDYLQNISISQMLQIIDENNKRFNLHLEIYHRESHFPTGGFWRVMINEDKDYFKAKELCDCLWQATKKILENENV